MGVTRGEIFWGRIRAHPFRNTHPEEGEAQSKASTIDTASDDELPLIRSTYVNT